MPEQCSVTWQTDDSLVPKTHVCDEPEHHDSVHICHCGEEIYDHPGL